jgi:type IV fimbrial biogenesis protein FimT
MLKAAHMTGDRGFTLVELMIGVAVAMIVFGVGLPSFSVWIQNTRIRTVAESMMAGLQLARSEAVLRNAPVNFTPNGVTGWTVGCVPPGTATCPEVIQSRPAGEGSSAAVTVATSEAMPIRFNGLGQMILPVLPAGTAFTTIDVDIEPSVLSAAQSRNLRITVNLAGGIRLCDPNVAAGDSRAC